MRIARYLLVILWWALVDDLRTSSKKFYGSQAPLGGNLTHGPVGQVDGSEQTSIPW
jgi:hypothetical protein